MDRRKCGWIFVLALGCFSESPSPEGGCERGAAGCPCDGGACNATLECMAELDLCIPAGCDPGTELCTCHDGDCFGDLHCDGGLCRPVGGSSGVASGSMGSSTSAGTIAEVTSASEGDGTVGATVTTAMSTTPAETGDPTDTMTTVGDTGMPQTSDGTDSGVDGGPCHACLLSADESGGACEMAVAACGSECYELAACVTGCIDAGDPGCIGDCCIAHPGGVNVYGDLSSCWETECAMMCVDFTLHCG